MHLERNELHCNRENARCKKQQNICYITQQYLLLAGARIIPPLFLCHVEINSELTRNNPVTANCIYALVSAKQCVSAGKTKSIQGEYQRCSGIAAGSCELWGGF